MASLWRCVCRFHFNITTSALPLLSLLSVSQPKLLKWKYKTVRPKENRMGSSSYLSSRGHCTATAISITIKKTQNNGKHFGREKTKRRTGKSNMQGDALTKWCHRLQKGMMGYQRMPRSAVGRMIRQRRKKMMKRGRGGDLHKSDKVQ